MITKTQLIRLERYLDQTRGIGHTTAMLNGARNADCLILARDQHHVDCLKRLSPRNNAVNLQSLDYDLYGIRKPILIDNGTMIRILHDSISEINRLEDKICEMKQLIGGITEKVMSI